MSDGNKKKAKRIKKAVKHHTQMLALFTAVIIIWWAVWGLFDEYLFHYLLPNDRTLAYVIGIIIGIFIIYLNDYDLEDFLG